jgi:putative ABC transport system permease protein
MNSRLPQLPKNVIRFLKLICPGHLFEETEGDLIQRFRRDAVRYGERKARRRMVWNAVRFFRPGILLRNKVSLVNPFHMTAHFLKVMLRVNARNKVLSFINVSGLVLGMTAFVFIMLYVMNERSYDTFHVKGDHIFRIRQDRYTGKELTRQWTAGPWGIGNDLKSNFPEVVRYVNVNRGGMRSSVLSNGATFFKEERIYYASEDFFEIFTYQLIKGVDSLVLKRPFTMVVSESLARRYFGEVDPIGKTLMNNGRHEYEITGVFKDVPENTHLKFDALLSFESIVRILGPAEIQDLMDNWGWAGNYTYVELSPGTDRETFEAKLPPFVEKKMGGFLKEWGEEMKFVLQPVPSIHLYSNFKDEMEANGDVQVVNFLILIAVFVLIMAWINYINLATARSIERAKEVGVRKVIGSNRVQIIKQFLIESFAIKALALAITSIVVVLLLPQFSTFVGRIIVFQSFQPGVWMFFVGVFISGIAVAGVYPSLILSGFKPALVLKGRLYASVKGNYMRKGLVTVQFVSSVVLIVGTFTVYKQLDFMRNGELGVDTEQVLVVQGPHLTDSTFYNKYETFRESLLRSSEVNNVSVSTDVPGRTVRGSNGGVRIVGQETSVGNSFRVIMSDENFTKTYGMTLMEGRAFSREFNEPWKTCLVNETAMKLLGFRDPKKIIGQRIYVWDNELEIIGVLKDYHQESFKKKVDQLIFVCDRDARDYFSIKLGATKDHTEMVNRVHEKFETIFPGNPFTFFFADDYYDQQYRSDQQFAKIFGLFTGLAIFIACLGLFGLSSYMALQRTKEIGIRKVMGATVSQIAVLVSKEFFVIVIIANLLAWPFAYFIINNWLSTFAYRINLGVLAFLTPGGCALIIAILTVSVQSVKAALANPVDSLRSE